MEAGSASDRLKVKSVCVFSFINVLRLGVVFQCRTSVPVLLSLSLQCPIPPEELFLLPFSRADQRKLEGWRKRTGEEKKKNPVLLLADF